MICFSKTKKFVFAISSYADRPMSKGVRAGAPQFIAKNMR